MNVKTGCLKCMSMKMKWIRSNEESLQDSRDYVNRVDGHVTGQQEEVEVEK